MKAWRRWHRTYNRGWNDATARAEEERATLAAAWHAERQALVRVRELLERDGWRGSTYAASVRRALDGDK